MILWLLACEPMPPPPAFTPASTAPGWWSGADVPSPRQEHGVVAWSDTVVIVAGVDDGPQTGRWVQAFDPTEGTWSSLPELPASVHHPNVAVVDGSIVVLGALDSAFREVDEAWVLRPGAASWTALGPMPPDRVVGSAGVGVLDGQVHLVGGLRGGVAVALHTVWDPTTNTWTALPDAPHARDHLAAGVVDGTLIVTAGRQRALTAFVDATDRWTPATGWTSGAPIPTPRGGVAATAHNGQLHVLGGEGNPDDRDGVFATHEAYDPTTDRWTRYEDMPAPRHGMGATSVDGVLWVPGGAPVDGFGAEATNHGWIE